MTFLSVPQPSMDFRNSYELPLFTVPGRKMKDDETFIERNE